MPYTRLLDSPGKWGTPLTPFAYLRLRWEKCAGFRLAPWMAHVENPTTHPVVDAHPFTRMGHPQFDEAL